MDYEKAFESRFIRPCDLDGKEWTLTLASYRVESLPSKFGPKRPRGIVGFQGARKEWVVNRTNAECLQGMWGRETDAWLGHRVTLHGVQFEGDLAIRVKGSPDLEAPLDVQILRIRASSKRRDPEAIVRLFAVAERAPPDRSLRLWNQHHEELRHETSLATRNAWGRPLLGWVRRHGAALT